MGRAPELKRRGAGARVPVGNPVGMRLGSHVFQGRGGGCGSGGRGPRGPARGPCSAPGPPRAASSRTGALGPTKARAARQGPRRLLGERLPARYDGRSAGELLSAAGGRAARARAWRRERDGPRRPARLKGFSQRRGLERSLAAVPAPLPSPRPRGDPTPKPTRCPKCSSPLPETSRIQTPHT